MRAESYRKKNTGNLSGNSMYFVSGSYRIRKHELLHTIMQADTISYPSCDWNGVYSRCGQNKVPTALPLLISIRSCLHDFRSFTDNMSSIQQQRLIVEQLRREASMKRISVSQAIEDIKVSVLFSRLASIHLQTVTQ